MLERACVHCYSQNNQYFVVDGNSGAVHKVDSLAYVLIQEIKAGTTPSLDRFSHSVTKNYSRDVLHEAIGEIQNLIDEGVLFSPDITSAPPRPDSVVKALCLNVAHDCNLRCTYCFAETGDFGGHRELMDIAIASQAVDFLIANSGSRRLLEIDFFGGEPLLNFSVVKETVFYGLDQAKIHNKEFRFTITTNGLAFTDDVQEFCNKYMDNVVLSIDGRPDVNDRVRYTPSGKKSVYHSIVPKYQQFVQARQGKSYYVRGTFTHENLDFTNDVTHLADLGFDQISMEPVVADANQPYALTEEDLPRILMEYDALADAFLAHLNHRHAFSFFHFNVELKKGPCLYKRLSGCGAGYEYLAVTPQGDLYPCHQFIGDLKFKVGDVFQGLTNTSLKHKLQDAHVLNKAECTQCWAKYYCSGGCHANNLAFNNDLRIPYSLACQMERKRLECSFFVHASISDENNHDE